MEQIAPARDADPAFSSSAFERNLGGYQRLAAKLCDTRWQIYFSGVVAIFLTFGQLVANEGNKFTLPTTASFHDFLFGIGSVSAIIAPLTFGFLIQQAHKAQADKQILFHRYQDQVVELREYLKKLYDEMGVTNKYTEFLASLEITKSGDFDGPPVAYYWWQWAAIGLIAWLEDNAADERSTVDFDEVHHGLMPRLRMIEELLLSAQVNAIQRAVIALVLTNPVINLFWVIASVLTLAALSSVYYDGVSPIIYYLCTVFLATFMVVAIFQLGRYARYEAKTVMMEQFEG